MFVFAVGEETFPCAFSVLIVMQSRYDFNTYLLFFCVKDVKIVRIHISIHAFPEKTTRALHLRQTTGASRRPCFWEKKQRCTEFGAADLENHCAFRWKIPGKYTAEWRKERNLKKTYKIVDFLKGVCYNETVFSKWGKMG
ncbi:hypothetical protein LI073_05405 [bacterium 210917-SL.2.15]|nr:hypothetical protein [bacterium 210917-SL.2.15]